MRRAYNLGVLLADENPEDALRWCRRALELRPAETKYAWTLAFYLARSGENAEAVRILDVALRPETPVPDLYALLGEIHEHSGNRAAAAQVYGRAARNDRLPPNIRAAFEERRQALEEPDG